MMPAPSGNDDESRRKEPGKSLKRAGEKKMLPDPKCA
jgi:hypothetical protein